MPQVTGISTKSDVPTSGQPNRLRKGIPLANGARKNWSKCMSLQSQGLVRCQKRPFLREANKPTFKLHTAPKAFKSKIHGGTLTNPSVFHNPPTPKCRKSQSMIELSPSQGNSESSDQRSTSRLARMGQIVDRTREIPCLSKTEDDPWSSSEADLEVQQLKEVSKKAGSLVCHALALNAWRRRREEVVVLQGTIEHLSQQVDHSQLQIVVLRRLLDTENSRVGKLGVEVHRAKAQLEKTMKEKDALSGEKDKLENEVKLITKVSHEHAIVSENFKNELLSAKSQLEALDAQIARDREKLLKLREDKKILLEKVITNEGLACERGERADEAEKTVEDLRGRLAIQMGIINDLQEVKQELTRNVEAAEVEKIKLERRLSASEAMGKALSSRAASLESQLGDRDAALRKIESAYSFQLIELNDLKDRLLRQSQEIGWSSRVLQLAGSVVRAPRAILRTLSFLSPSGEPSHP